VYCTYGRLYHHVMKPTAALILFCAVACSTFAQTAARPSEDKDLPIWRPQQVLKFDDDTLHIKATVPKEMIASLRVSDVTIRLEEDSELEALPARFGGEIGSQGDASESLGWLCLHGVDAKGPWVLWLESGEIDGPYVGAFLWRRGSHSSRFDDRCAALPDTSKVELPIDLGLGASEAKVIQTLGRPSSRKGDILFYKHEHNESIRGETFTSSNTVVVALRHGVVHAIAVSKTTIN